VLFVMFIPSRISIAMTLGLKDMCLALMAAQHLNVPLLVARSFFGFAQGQDCRDWAVLAKISAKNAGLPCD
jgi:hypothetical protein